MRHNNDGIRPPLRQNDPYIARLALQNLNKIVAHVARVEGRISLDSLGFEGFVALSKQTAEIVAQMAATRAVAIHHGAVLLVALAEKGLIDPRRVFAINEDVATEFEQLAQEHAGDGVRGRVHAIVAQALRELEVTSRSLAATPADANERDRQRPGRRRAAS